MADFDNPAFEPDDCEEDIGDDYDLSNSLHDPDIDGDNMSSSDGAVVQTSIRQELLQTAVDDYYNATAEGGLTPSLGRDPSKFELDGDGRPQLKAYPNLNLVNKRSGRPLALSTITRQPGGAITIREELGFADWTRAKSSFPAQAVESLQTANRQLGEAAAAVDTVELQDLGQTATETSDAIHRMETDSHVDELLGTLDDPLLSLREIRGLDKALQTIRGELTNNLAKLTELDKHIALERQKLDTEGIDEFSRHCIADRLEDLQVERLARLEAAAASKQALHSQINRMRETISRILHEDTTLAERVRTLFREQGVTLLSILTAIGMAISTLVLALTGGASGGSHRHPHRTRAVFESGPKKTLQALGRVLAKLAGKAAVALPGIIGSIVSWLLSTLGKATGWLAEHLWALVVGVVGLLCIAARSFLAPQKQH